MPKKKPAPKAQFPRRQAEFAGELAPGPVSGKHEDRMVRKEPGAKASP